MLQNPETGESVTMSAEDKADAYNRASGSLTDFDCPICHNKGFIAEARDGAMITRECECQAKRRSMRRIRYSGLADLMDVYTFQRFETPEEWQKTAKAKAMQYVTDGAGKWFFITGTPGTGKSHICTAIAGALMSGGKDLRYMLWRSDAARIKALITDAEAYAAELGKLKTAPVLYIDDFFKGKITDADVNLAFELLNERYSRRRTMTLISTEKSMEELLDIDEAIGSRIYERSKGYCIRTGTQNWRLR